ncbi:hypothetical protein [Embleya sp. NPDC001921]
MTANKSISDQVGLSDSVGWTMRTYLSAVHIYAARYSTEVATKIEGSIISPAYDIRHQGAVISAIVESVAFMEATVNEIYQDAADSQSAYVGALGADVLGRLAAIWKASNGGYLEILEKFSLVLNLADHPDFDRGRDPYQSARDLIRLRNYLIHYRPHDSSSEAEHKLTKILRGRFPDNTLVVPGGGPWLPKYALGAGCAEWAWRAARAFADDFSARLSVPLMYQTADFQDPLPS